ncbi:hypothetical protein [Streptomyces sp. OR43]|uniref:hypothetical protein n=1 Tax=Streptomyces sp. or43 TaxID=2478957 RepID=UPI0011CD53DB|nr:hypothetical protein [Streptomyces sp. or43]TXS48899.1 hypothetical protein EAO72_02795 [Streptomyces sp. or43]
MNDDTFWAEQRAIGTASCSQHAGPTACGTCQSNVQAGKRVEHEECSQRATLLQAPDHPDYELLAGFSLEENAKLPVRFHIPVFDDCGEPNSWLCAVCWEDGVVSQWPCKTATEQGTRVFTPLHEAETTQKQSVAAVRIEAIADRDAQIIAWLEKKAAEEGTSNKAARVRATAIYRMADKLSRGAVRPPLSKGADTSAEDALSAIRTAAQDGDMARVRQLVTDYYAALRGAEDTVAVTS